LYKNQISFTSVLEDRVVLSVSLVFLGRVVRTV